MPEAERCAWLEIGGEKRISVKFTIVDYRVDRSREGNDPRTGVVNQIYVHPTADRRGIHKHGLAEESGRNGLNDSTRNGRQGQALVEPITHFCMESLTLQLVLSVPNCRGGLGFYYILFFCPRETSGPAWYLVRRRTW